MNKKSDLHIRRILAVLTQAKGPAPLGYISRYSEIKEPLDLLVTMEKQGLVHRTSRACESCHMEPLFELPR